MSRTIRLGSAHPSHRSTDKKPWYKPPKWYKVMTKRIRRAREKQAIRNWREPPRFRKSDVYDWT